MPISKWIKFRLLSDFCCNHEVLFRVRFRLVSRLSLLCMEYRSLQIWSHLLKKSLMENFIFSAVDVTRTKKEKYKSPSDLPLRTFAIKSYIWTSLICDLEWLMLHYRWRVKVSFDEENTAGLPLIPLAQFFLYLSCKQYNNVCF